MDEHRSTESGHPDLSSAHADLSNNDALAALGWTATHTEQFAPYVGVHVPARIARVERGGAEAVTADGTEPVTYGGALLAAAATERADFPAAGDWCAVRRWPDGPRTIEALLPRRTSLVRDSAGQTSHGQVVAANVDLVVVVEHLVPAPSIARIERLLALAWASGAVPLVVLTKADLVPDAETMRAEVVAAAPGVEVATASVVDGTGLTWLRDQLPPGRTAVLAGPSGAGKSSLVNAAAGTELMAVGDVRTGDGKGRHTTTHRELLILPDGGVIIDTPGLRGVGLTGDPDAVAEVFAEIEEFAAECRFRDCAHEGEPECAVEAAVNDGRLDELRLARWRKLGREAAYLARRSDARLRAQERAEWKRRSKSLRARYRLRSDG